MTSHVRFGEQLLLKQRILRFLAMLRPVKSGEGRSKKWQAGANGYGGKVRCDGPGKFAAAGTSTTFGTHFGTRADFAGFGT